MQIFLSIMKVIWLIITNRFVVPAIIAGLIFIIFKAFGTKFGKSQKVLYLILTIILELVMNWNYFANIFSRYVK
jgi:hypothetical protein